MGREARAFCDVPRAARSGGPDTFGAWHADLGSSRPTGSTTSTLAAPAGWCSLRTTTTAGGAQYGLYGLVVARHGWKIHAHCLMRTHHHVLVEAPHDALVRGMHLLGTCQAMHLNRRQERFGHATAGRFGSTALHTHADVARVAMYIANNPVDAGVVDDPSTFAWSSHRRRSASSRRRTGSRRAGCPACSVRRRRAGSPATDVTSPARPPPSSLPAPRYESIAPSRRRRSSASRFVEPAGSDASRVRLVLLDVRGDGAVDHLETRGRQTDADAAAVALVGHPFDEAVGLEPVDTAARRAARDHGRVGERRGREQVRLTAPPERREHVEARPVETVRGEHPGELAVEDARGPRDAPDDAHRRRVEVGPLPCPGGDDVVDVIVFHAARLAL